MAERITVMEIIVVAVGMGMEEVAIRTEEVLAAMVKAMGISVGIAVLETEVASEQGTMEVEVAEMAGMLEEVMPMGRQVRLKVRRNASRMSR